MCQFFLKYRSFFLNKYRCKLCTCVNIEMGTCAKTFNIPVLISLLLALHIFTNTGSKII